MMYKLMAIEALNMVMSEDIGNYNLYVKDLLKMAESEDKIKSIIVTEDEYIILNNITNGLFPKIYSSNYNYPFTEICLIFTRLKKTLEDSDRYYEDAQNKLEYDLKTMSAVYTDGWKANESELINVLEYVRVKFESNVMLVFVEQS